MITGRCHRCQEDTQLSVCEEPEPDLRFACPCEICGRLAWDASVTNTFHTRQGTENRPPLIKAWDWPNRMTNSSSADSKTKIYSNGLPLNNTSRSVRTLRISLAQAAKRAVWSRDGGARVKCGSSQKLKFDHIISCSKGGADSVENLQIFCRTCNRSKGPRISLP